jgi:hypothetical protein
MFDKTRGWWRDLPLAASAMPRRFLAVACPGPGSSPLDKFKFFNRMPITLLEILFQMLVARSFA